MNLLRVVLSRWAGMSLLRVVSGGWDGVNLLRVVLSGWVEMNFDDDVEERNDRCLMKSGQSLGDSDRSQRNDRNQWNNHCPVNDRHQMNHHSRRIVVFWSDLECKDENNDVPDNKGLVRIVDRELASTHREDRHAYLKKAHRIQG